jgi:hypothetical protein
MRTSMFSFATDFHDEGVDVALGRIAERGGLGGVTVAAVYHHGRDIFPHSPVRRVRFLEGGTAFFRPDPARYADTPVKPVASRLAEEWDPLAELRAATSARGLELHAWTVFLHNTRLGTDHPDAAVENVFGDPQLTYLCPANPAAVAYARGLAGDIARYELDSLLAESLHYLPLEHGFHHERYLINIGPVDRLLLGLCFCRHCRALAGSHGVDTDALVRAVGARLERFFETAAAYDPTEATREHVATLWDGELDSYLRAREDAVAQAAAAVADELDGTGTRFAFMDQAGAMKGYADGEPTGGPAPEVSWQIGIDPARLAAACDEFQILAYAKDPDRVAGDVAAYRELLGDTCEIRAGFRPIPPDCDDTDNLRAKLAAASDGGVVHADFYHYGFARLETLDLIRSALAG